MKKILACLLALGLASCSCTKEKVVTNTVPEVSSTSVEVTLPETKLPFVVSLEDVELVLPSEDWKLVSNDKTEIKLLAKNDKLNNLVVFVKEQFKGTYDEYALTNIRGLKDQGAVITKSDQFEFGGVTWVFVSSTNKDVNLYQWVTYRNGYGYALSCGGKDNDQATVCQQISSTLKLN